MSATIKKILDVLLKYEKNRTFLFIFLLLTAIFVEGLSVVMVFPLITLITKNLFTGNFDIFNNIFLLEKNYTQNELIVFASLIIFFVYFLKSSYLIFFSWWRNSYIYRLNSKISSTLLKKYINKPVEFFFFNNSASLIRNTYTETRIFTHAVNSLLILIVECLAITIIVSILFAIQFKSTLIIFILFSIFGFIFNILTKKKIRGWGRERQNLSGNIIKNLQQSFGLIKDIKIDGKEDFFLDKYSTDLRRLNDITKKQFFIAEFPKNILELLTIVFIILVVFILLAETNNLLDILPTIGLFAAASVRVVPAINRILLQFQSLNHDLAAVQLIYPDIKLEEKNENEIKKLTLDKKIKFKNEIEIKNIFYKYPNTENYILNNFNLKIKKNNCICFIGSSGIGKTTLIDIFNGLLKPTSGEITVDGVDIFENLRSWQDQIGYISQSVYLTDETISNNIAFGIKEENVDKSKINECIKNSQLIDLIDNLPDGINHKVGEIGTNLSVGQIQRIGIARSLYKNPQILICDEITSALDTETEKKLLDCLNNLAGKITIIFISHSNNVIKNADKVYSLEYDKNMQSVLVEKKL